MYLQRANHQGLTGTWFQDEGDKGGSNGRGKRRQAQALSAGRRVKRQGVAGDGWV